MSDIDILIQLPDVDLVMSKLANLGYEITDEQWRDYHELGHHHLPEARHPTRGISIEVHTGLFSREEFYAPEFVFQQELVAEQTIDFDYKGARVSRFTPEFQFIFTVSKWSADKDWAVNLKNVNDTIHILRKYESEFDWPTLTLWFTASPHLYPITDALMTYLEQAGIVTVSPGMRKLLDGADRQTGSVSRKLLVWLLHNYPFNARDKSYRGYSRWWSHAAWLFLTLPGNRGAGLLRVLWRQFYLSALYGKYNPVGRQFSKWRALRRDSDRR